MTKNNRLSVTNKKKTHHFLIIPNFFKFINFSEIFFFKSLL